MTEAILAACIQLSGKYLCSSSAATNSSKSIVKVDSSVVDGAYNYRFGVVGRWDFLADGDSHPMKAWPRGSAYRAVCSPQSLAIEQLREKAGKSHPCGGQADRIIYFSEILALDDEPEAQSFAFTKAESHHCASGRVVDIPSVTFICRR